MQETDRLLLARLNELRIADNADEPESDGEDDEEEVNDFG